MRDMSMELERVTKDAMFGALCIEALRKGMPAHAISDCQLTVEGDGGMLTVMALRNHGLPYGHTGRTIFEWLIANAHMGMQRQPIDLGYDPRDLMDEMGLVRSPTSEEDSTILDFIDQFHRLSMLRFDFAGAGNGFFSYISMSIISAADFNWRPFESRWTGRPHSKIILNEMFISGSLHLLPQSRQTGITIDQ